MVLIFHVCSQKNGAYPALYVSIQTKALAIRGTIFNQF